MVVLLLCEPRSGSTNLTNWFYNNKDFTTLYNPDIEPNYRSLSSVRWYQEGKSPKDYKYVDRWSAETVVIRCKISHKGNK